MSKWDKNKIVASAYGEKVELVESLRKGIKHLIKERRNGLPQINGIASIFEAIKAAQEQAQPEADETPCDCPACTAAREARDGLRRAEQDSRPQAQGEPVGPNPNYVPPNATEPAFYRTTDKATDKATTHPWDAEWPTNDNPLGMTARQLMMEKDIRIRNLNQEVDRLNAMVADVRTKNTELEARIQGQKQEHPFARAVVSYQPDVVKQVDRLWGNAALNNQQERVQRFAEEAAELVQSCGLDLIQFWYVVSWVYGRPPGPKPREVGGTLVTLAALCHAFRMDMFGCGLAELQRLQEKEPEEMQGRHIAKPKTIRTV